MGGVCGGYRLPRKVLMTGPAGSGKTTLLYHWCLQCDTRTMPTVGFNVETVNVQSGGLFLVWDVTDPIRRRQFYHGSEAVVYVIDGSDASGLTDIRSDLDVVLNDRDLKHLPLLLVVTKLDISGSCSISNVEKQLSVIITDRQYDITEVRADDMRTYNEALKKLCNLVYS